MFGWNKNKKVQEPEKPKAQIHKTALMKNNPMKRAMTSLNLGSSSPVISFGFTAGNQAGNINAIINRTLPVMVAASRELSIKNGIVKKYVATNSAGVTGADGLYIRPCSHSSQDDKVNQQVNKQLEDAFYAWAEDPKAFSRCGTLDISTFQRLVERTRSIDGDCFIRIHQTRDGMPQVEIIDSMRISTYENQILPSGNYISNGIEFDIDTNRPVAYWITRYNPIMYNYLLGERERVPAEEILHLFQQDYPTQQRGIPDVHAGTDKLKELEEFMVAAITSRKVAASAMAFITNPDSDEIELLKDDDVSYYEQDYLNPAAIVELQAGQDIKTVNPTQTTDGISEFVDNQLMMIAMGLDITKQSLTSDTSNASFSAAKLTDKLQQSTFKTRTNALVVSVLKPLYVTWLKAAMINNSALSNLSFSDFNNLTHAQYVPTRQISLDPYKDLQTEVLAIDSGLKSKTMVISEMGYDPAVVMEEIQKEKMENGIEPEEGDQSNTD
ncbi:phage portal protein [Citrobacter sp. FDAARGOS_156]|uniref:phage portal protein n=1 Tax=Citrobacter sp. FDAARGOS_156 TaxID=1702170 RepID=UPI0019023288|nr:phage portal protein [Citrobacter sp. FDAARGOS_156]MBJ8884423.1 phage portal protein [Citrobacter sp. FDAARGOS_156]